MELHSTSSPELEDDRTEELRERLDAVRARIDRAVALVGRRERPELIVVTKFFPAEDVLRLLHLGVTDVGENRDQEASAKADAVDRLIAAHTAAHPDLPLAPPRWHFIGQLQSNKARSVLRYASSVHSVDRSSLLKALRRAAAGSAESQEAGAPAAGRAREVDCLIQVDLRTEIPSDARGGARPEQIAQLADSVQAAEGLRLAGLMAVAPLDEPPGPAFARLAELSAELRTVHPEAVMVSAGMSNDLEEAVAHGATHLRIGRDVLGNRPAPR
ncbi:YggS family pyridoxal phosphate enzyme [Nesterenkonia aethiopica]|uniref:Pyridoxal phosphate homeostasis protein n=2 Tax=Actinomycetes TaxID=1760 RepID=A0ABP6LP79_9MICC